MPNKHEFGSSDGDYRVTCMILRTDVTEYPALIKKSDIAPAMYPEIAIVPHGTALNQAACFKFTLNTYWHYQKAQLVLVELCINM